MSVVFLYLLLILPKPSHVLPKENTAFHVDFRALTHLWVKDERIRQKPQILSWTILSPETRKFSANHKIYGGVNKLGPNTRYRHKPSTSHLGRRISIRSEILWTVCIDSGLYVQVILV